MSIYFDARTQAYAPTDSDQMRRGIAAVLLVAIWLSLCAVIVCAALGLVASVVSMIDSDLTDQVLFGLLAAINPPFDLYPIHPLT